MHREVVGSTSSIISEGVPVRQDRTRANIILRFSDLRSDNDHGGRGRTYDLSVGLNTRRGGHTGRPTWCSMKLCP